MFHPSACEYLCMHAGNKTLPAGSDLCKFCLDRATKTLGALMVERNVPTLGLKGVRKWLDKRCEKKVAKQGPVPAPTQPLPWDHFRRMPKRLTGGRRHYNVPLPSDSNESSSNAPGTGAYIYPMPFPLVSQGFSYYKGFDYHRVACSLWSHWQCWPVARTGA